MKKSNDLYHLASTDFTMSKLAKHKVHHWINTALDDVILHERMHFLVLIGKQHALTRFFLSYTRPIKIKTIYAETTISVVKIRRLLREQRELKIPQESLLSEEAEAVPAESGVF
ncbi:hypothetical protein [Aureibacillus halotolerans]|uniref:Uncharacterized protein n=1 Tax=Aureibacillus halotolerans TaxID=1508390 RepID=A0A4R6U691_9BACI|nr:hypothetical protein [Aureibacillus halotolerans]TDQ42018.1 hypothetical protein EV213_10246 [Aureibacillus halotolerans]